MSHFSKKMRLSGESPGAGPQPAPKIHIDGEKFRPCFHTNATEAASNQGHDDFTPAPLSLDSVGSMLEGGGQILRMAASLAAITGTPISVDSIRANRAKPGLRPQHLTGLQLVASLCHGSLEGGTIGSTEISLVPGPLRCEDACADTGTAGSCMLLAQVALPCLLFASPVTKESEEKQESLLELRGGTDASMAPPVGYMQHVLLPTLRKHIGIEADVALIRRGFFPKGQGMVSLRIRALSPGTALPAFTIKPPRRAVPKISVLAFTAGKVKATVGERMAAAAEKAIRARPEVQFEALETTVTHEPAALAFGDGCGILLVAETAEGCVLGASGVGERDVSAEEVGSRAGGELADAMGSGACVDAWLMDQLVIFMALARGESEVVGREPTLHTRTAIAVAEALTAAKFSVEKYLESGEREDCLWSVKCQGIGHTAPSFPA